MKTNNNNNRESLNSNKINDFGAKIGGARKDLFAAAHEWAAQLADITAEALTKAGGVSKLVRLPNLEKLAEGGAITADQARAALIIWRGIERKPAGSYRADRWAERTRARLEAAAAIITGTEPTADNVADIIKAARESAEFAVITAAQWPALPFSFGKYGSARPWYGNKNNYIITTGDRRYFPQEYSDPAEVVARLREMVAADEQQAAERRAAGPRLGVYMNRAGVYYIAPAERSEIVLQTYENRADALKAYQEDRAALVARYTALKNFPACRRDWNRPRVGEDWRNGENMTPEQFAAVLPFRGVEFGNWVNQTERAALLNSAFDGFHDLAAVLNIAPAAVTLGGSLAFAFASRGHSGAAAHYEPARRVINLTKKSGAGCMAHEWFHAVDNFAAGGGVNTYATESSEHPRAFAILQAIKRTAYYKRSQNLARFKGDYWTEGRELTARAFEGVCAVMLNAAGICSDFLVNCKSMDEFTAEDVARRSDYYPYPTADEAAALLPLYVNFLREVFGEELTAPAVCYEDAKRAAERAEAERKEAERIAAERAEAEQQERERKAAEHREKLAREAEEREQAAAGAVEMLREVLTARHFDAIATGYDCATVYAVAHLEGEIYTISADIQTANERGRAYIESRPGACIHYKRVHNAKRIICRRWQAPEIRANNWNARELVEALTITDARGIVRTFCDFEKAETWAKAAELWETTQRAKAEQIGKAEKPAKAEPKPTPSDNAAPAAGLHLEDTADGVRVIGDEWKDTYFNKKDIKAHGATWNKERKQWEATDPAAVASLRAWFALRDEEQAAPAADPTTLQQAGEITDTTNEPAAETLPEWATEGARATILRNGEQLRGYITEIHKAFRGGHYLCTFHELGTLFNIPVNVSDCAPVEEPAAVLPEWLKVGARVRTRGRYMLSARTMRREWVEGEEMTVKEINGDFVRLENRREDGIITSSQGIATNKAAAELTPIYSASEKSEEPAIAASYDTAETESESKEPAATYETSATADEQQQADALPFMEKAAILDKVTARIYAPWGDVSKMWLCPFRGANDVWNAWARGLNLRDCGRLAEWALTAKVGERAEYRGLLVQIWERDGQTAAEPESEADRLTANRETRERLRAAIVAELEAAAVYLYPLNNEMKIFGKVKTAAELSRVEDIARRYSSAQYWHEDCDTVFEFNLPLFFPHFFPTDPTPEPSGEGVALCHSFETGAPCYSASDKSEHRREVTTLINGNGQPYQMEVPTVEIHGFMNDTAEPVNYSEGEKSQTPASDWADPNIIAQARADNPQWPEEFTTPEFYDRQGLTDERGHRIKTAREIMDQARRIECNYIAGRGGLRDIAHRQERTKGANHPDTLRAYERLQSRARLLRAAELEAYRTAGEARRAAWYREHSQQADTLEQGGEITAPSSKPERMKTRGEVFAQYFRILHQLSDGKTWNDPQARHRAGVIINALNRYQDNFAKVPKIARLYNTHHFLEDGTDPAKAANEIPVPRSVYMGLSKPRRKSMQDVYKQAGDLLRVLYFAPHCVDNSRRYNRIEAIQERYLTNIAQSLGYLSFETFSDFSSKTKPGTNDRKDADRDYTLKVNREDYAHPVNVERIRKAETWQEVNAYRNSLYHQGARPCEGCPFAKGADFCPYTGGGTVEECKSRLIDTIKTEAA